MDHFMIEQGEGQTINLVTFIGDKTDGKYDPDLVFATKNFRKLNQKTPDGIYDLKYWYIEDQGLANQLGVESAGDVYMIKVENEHSKTQIQYRGFPISSSVFL